MSSGALQDRLIEEIRKIPEPKLAELYEFIHYFRLGVQADKSVDERASDLPASSVGAVAAFRASGLGGATERLLSDRKADRLREA